MPPWLVAASAKAEAAGRPPLVRAAVMASSMSDRPTVWDASQRLKGSRSCFMRRSWSSGDALVVSRTGADELMVTANIFDHTKRKRSFEIVAQVHGGMKGAAPSQNV